MHIALRKIELGIYMLYLRWSEFAWTMRGSVEIVEQAFEYLENTGSELILVKRRLYN